MTGTMFLLLPTLAMSFNCDLVDFEPAKGCKMCVTFNDTNCPPGYDWQKQFRNQSYCRKRCDSTVEECFKTIKDIIDNNDFNQSYQNAWLAEDNGVLYENHAACLECIECDSWTAADLSDACKRGFRSFHVKTACAAASRVRRDETRIKHQLFEEKEEEEDDDTVVIAVSVSGGVVVVGAVGYFVYRRSKKGTLASFAESLM